jgi:hypothetical protein
MYLRNCLSSLSLAFPSFAALTACQVSDTSPSEPKSKARAEPQINDGWGTVSLQTPMFLPMERKKDGSRLIQPKGRPISASRIYGISQPNELPSTLTCKKFGSLLANRITFMERDTLGHRTKEAAFTFESENFPSGAVDLETHKGNSRFNVVY